MRCDRSCRQDCAIRHNLCAAHSSNCHNRVHYARGAWPAATWPAPSRLLTSTPCHQHNACSFSSRHCRTTVTAAAAGPSNSGCGPADKSSVVEYLLLLKAKPDVDAEQMEVLLDALWSLQYLIPAGILCASAGPVIDCAAYHQHQQQDMGQEGWQCGFTHAVHYRVANRSSLEHFLAHPLMGSARDQMETLCSSSSQLVFEGLVAKRLEALFRRGEEYESGVEHVLLMQPGVNAGVGADEFLNKLAGLAESSVAGGIQASHGAVISCVHAAATHVLMTRFAAVQQVQQLLDTPACAAVVSGDSRVPVVAVGSLCISVQPTEESAQVSGSSGAGLGRL